jgi:hypothetical protein
MVSCVRALTCAPELPCGAGVSLGEGRKQPRNVLRSDANSSICKQSSMDSGGDNLGDSMSTTPASVYLILFSAIILLRLLLAPINAMFGILIKVLQPCYISSYVMVKM